MTTEKIKAGNNLIAEFMGYHLHKGLYINKDAETHVGNTFYEDSSKYHSSWEWLMSVVEKIESIENSDDYEVDIFGNCCDIGGRFESIGKTKIEATFRAVIKFVEWYNKK